MRQLFLDCDGVLADFNGPAKAHFGLPPRKANTQLGEKLFWASLRAQKDWYFNLPLMHDARRLFDGVKHLNPVILTGCPAGGWAEPQKLAWGAKNFPGTPMICCPSVDKRLYMKPGDVLVDDYPKYRHLWEEAGGVFILHESADKSIEQVLTLFHV